MGLSPIRTSQSIFEMSKSISINGDIPSLSTKEINFANKDIISLLTNSYLNWSGHGIVPLWSAKSFSVYEDIPSLLMKEVKYANKDILFSLTDNYLNWSDHGWSSTMTFANQVECYNLLTIKSLQKHQDKGEKFRERKFLFNPKSLSDGQRK